MELHFKKIIRWWRCDGKEVDDEFQDELLSIASEQIHHKHAEGYVCGELWSTLSHNNEEVDFRGYWEIKQVA